MPEKSVNPITRMTEYVGVQRPEDMTVLGMAELATTYVAASVALVKSGEYAMRKADEWDGNTDTFAKGIEAIPIATGAAIFATHAVFKGVRFVADHLKNRRS